MNYIINKFIYKTQLLIATSVCVYTKSSKNGQTILQIFKINFATLSNQQWETTQKFADSTKRLSSGGGNVRGSLARVRPERARETAD